jgi:flagellar biosynthesis protein FlhG
MRAARLIAVGGGKGGVGKTFVASNLAAALSREGYTVIAVDGDLEGANLHTALGVTSPRVSLADYVAQREEDVSKLVVETPYARLGLIAATQAHLGAAQPAHFRRARLIQRLRALQADFVIVDLGAGMQPATLDYFLAADEALLVLTPEPTSVENAYGFLRSAFYRRMHLTLTSGVVRKLIAQAMDQRNEQGIRTPLDLVREVDARDPAEAQRFMDALQMLRPRLVVNEVSSAEEIKLGFAVKSVCMKYFGMSADYLGYVNRDGTARRAVVARQPLVVAQPDCNAAVYLGRIASKLADSPSGDEGSSGARGGRRENASGAA